MNQSYLSGEDSWRIRLLVFLGVALLHVLFYVAINYYSASFGFVSSESRVRIQVFSLLRRESPSASVSDEQTLSAESVSISMPAREKFGEGVAALEKRDMNSPVVATPSGSEEAMVLDGPLVLDGIGGDEYGQDFQRNIMTDDIPASFSRAEKGRFRMRRQISGKDVIEGTAQLLGLWPPGYTTDPCPQIRRNIGKLTNEHGPIDRELLDEELRRQRAFCR